MEHDPDLHDPSDQSGRPWIVTGAVAGLLAVLAILLVVGVVVLR